MTSAFPDFIFSLKIKPSTDIFFSGAYRWQDLLTLPTNYHRQKLQQLQKEINVHDICNIQFTSVSEIYTDFVPNKIQILTTDIELLLANILQGTTGATKGAALTHHNIVNNSYFVGKRMLLMDKVSVYFPNVNFRSGQN